MCVWGGLSCVQLFVSPWTLHIKLLCPWNSPDKNTGVSCHLLLWGSSWPRNWIWVSCIAGRFFTVWATKEGFFKNWKAYYSFLECYLFFSYERHLEQNSKVVWNRIMPLSPLPIVHSPLNLKYFEYLPQGGIDESFGNSIFNFWRNYHTIFHCGWSILHSQEQCIWVPILLHTHQHLLFVFIIVI